MIFINIPIFQGHLRPVLRFQVILRGTLDGFKICNYCRECVLQVLNCDTILETAFSFKKMIFFTIKAVDSVKKTKGHLTQELL